MRVIAGTFRSRTLDAPAGLQTRPTSDRLRETLFNVLAPRIQEATFLDLYAGSGAVGLEALSRGAQRVVFVERAPVALKAMSLNLTRLGLTQGFDIQSSSVSAYLRRARNKAEGFDIVFLDPPYDAAEEYAASLEQLGKARTGLLTTGSVVIAEHRRRERLEDRYESLLRTRLLEQGDAALSFYAVSETAQTG
jgi:16S rRNA (guanine966-N2)-methyltransferase